MRPRQLAEENRATGHAKSWIAGFFNEARQFYRRSAFSVASTPRQRSWLPAKPPAGRAINRNPPVPSGAVDLDVVGSLREWSRDSHFIGELTKAQGLELGVVDQMFRDAAVLKN